MNVLDGTERYLQIDPKSLLQGCCRGTADLDQRSAIYTAACIEACVPFVTVIITIGSIALQVSTCHKHHSSELQTTWPSERFLLCFGARFCCYILPCSMTVK